MLLWTDDHVPPAWHLVRTGPIQAWRGRSAELAATRHEDALALSDAHAAKQLAQLQSDAHSFVSVLKLLVAKQALRERGPSSEGAAPDVDQRIGSRREAADQGVEP